MVSHIATISLSIHHPAAVVGGKSHRVRLGYEGGFSP